MKLPTGFAVSSAHASTKKSPNTLRRRLRTYGAALLIVQLAAACSSPENSAESKKDAVAGSATTSGADAATTALAADTKLVVVFGDSLFAGYNLNQKEGFAPALERALNAQGTKTSVFNAGVSGDTTAAGSQRLAFTLDGLPRKPDLVIVGLGGNDMLRGLDAKETRKNLDAILTELDKRNIPAMLSGMVAAPNLGADYAATFNPIYADLARAHNVPLYPFFLEGVATHKDLLLPDGIHPNAKGIDIIVTNISPLVVTTLKAE